MTLISGKQDTITSSTDISCGNLDVSGDLNMYQGHIMLFNNRNIQADDDNSRIKINRFRINKFDSDSKFAFENVNSDEIFTIDGSGVTANAPIYRIPQMVFYNFESNSAAGSSDGDNNFGNGGRFNSISSTRRLGSSFCDIDNNGTISFTHKGYYKIRVAANIQSAVYNDRIAFAVYLNIVGTDYFEVEDYNFFGWSYTRNKTDGGHGNITFEDCIYISSSQTLQVCTKLDTDDVSFDSFLPTTQMKCFCNLQIERIAETDIIS